MSDNVVIPFPRTDTSLVRDRRKRLEKQFIEGGRRQKAQFERLSRIVERWDNELKRKQGEKSGAIGRAFGNQFRVARRFRPKEGNPDHVLCKTPATWLQVLKGFARELGQDEDQAIIAALEEAMADPRPPAGFAAESWLTDFSDLMGKLAANLRDHDDLAALLGYAAANGLFFEDGAPVVSEWPYDPALVPGGLYNPIVLSKVPHLPFVNYEPVTDITLNLTDDEDRAFLSSIWQPRSEDEQKLLEGCASLEIFEGTRTGIAFALRSDTGQPDIALVERQISMLRFLADDEEQGRRILVGFAEPLPPSLPIDLLGETMWQRPAHWAPNSVRFHFPGSRGFEDRAQAPMIAPWFWGDPDEMDRLFGPAPEDDKDYPLSMPRHTVAGAIEANLLYVDELGYPEQRIDRLLRKEIDALADRIRTWRDAGAARRSVRLKALLNEWGQSDSTYTQPGKED